MGSRTLMDKTILVTGGAGFMGSSFIRHLLKDQIFTGKILNLDALTYCGNLDNLHSVESDHRYDLIKGNICDNALVKSVFSEHKIDYVVHFAAETHVDRSIVDAAPFVETNVIGTVNLLEIIKKFPNIHFHHISTDEVYGALGDEGSFDEMSPYFPNSPYSASKAASDHFVRAYHKTYGIKATISHAGNNYGPFQYPEKLIPFMITRLISNETLPLYGTGNQVRDWVFVDDHSKAIESILLHGQIGEVYNIASEDEMSNLTLLKKLIRIYSAISGTSEQKLLDKICFIQDRPGHDFRYSMKAKKLFSHTGWKKTVSFEKGLEATLIWYLESGSWLDHLSSKQKVICV